MLMKHDLNHRMQRLTVRIDHLRKLLTADPPLRGQQPVDPALIAKLRTGIQEDLTYLQPALEGEPEPAPPEAA